MVDITKLRLDKITKSGFYMDDYIAYFNLSDEEILALREYYDDDTIASERVFESEKEKEVEQVVQTRKYKCVRDQKYNDGKSKLKGTVSKFGNRVIIGGIIATVVVGSGLAKLASLSNGNSGEIVDSTIIEEIESIPEQEFVIDSDNVINAYVSNPDEHEVKEEIPVQTDKVDIQTDRVDIGYYESSTSVGDLGVNFVGNSSVVENEVSREQIIKYYCDVYFVDYNLVYDKICELTDNFSSTEYLDDLTISGIKCKGQQVYADSEEKLLLLTIRHIKQIPTDFGFGPQQLYVNTEQQVLGENYLDKVTYYAKLFDLDRCLLRAIIQAESGFRSDQFVNMHNPVGLRDGVAFRSFDGDEEGLIEFCTEMVKYYEMGAVTFADIRDIHAPLSDGNDYWLDNVTDCYFDTVENELEYFGTDEVTNILGR